jgi:hypothetical protein
MPDKQLADLIVATWNLLGAPEADGALNRGTGHEFTSNWTEYKRNAPVSADRNGKNAPTDWPFSAPAVHRYHDEDADHVVGEGNDAVINQLSMTRTRPNPVIYQLNREDFRRC